MVDIVPASKKLDTQVRVEEAILIQLTHFEVQGLFGLFNHQLSFRTKERITILHAPNGFGKTAILKMIAGLFGGSLLVFRQYEFAFARFHFSDGTTITVRQSIVETDDKRQKSERRYDLIFQEQGHENERWSPWDEKGPIIQERMRIDLDVHPDERVFRERMVQRLDSAEAWERYSTYYPRGQRGGMPKRLEEARKLFDCRLIDTQRLMVRAERSSNRPEAKLDFIPAVRTFSQDVSVAIKNAIQQSAAITQRLDQSFPNRLLASFCRETPAFLSRRGSSPIKLGQTDGGYRHSPGILTRFSSRFREAPV